MIKILRKMRVMEFGNHFKNGARLKYLMGRKLINVTLRLRMLAITCIILGICVFLAACSSSSSKSSYNFQTPDPNIYDGKSLKDFRPMWFMYDNQPVAYIGEINSGNSKADDALWTVKVSIVGNGRGGFYTLSVKSKDITGQSIRVGDMVEYDRLDGVSGLKKVPAYIQYAPQVDWRKQKDYNPQKMDYAYKGKGLNGLVPKYQAYEWLEKYGYARIVKIEVPDIGLCKIYLEGPNGYKTVREQTIATLFSRQYYIGTVVQLTFIDRKFNKIMADCRANVVPLITPAEYNAFLHGDNPNGPLVVVDGKTAEQAMQDGTFDWFDYMPDEGESGN